MSQPDIENSHRFIGPLMLAALECLCEAVARNPNPPLNCCFRVGTQVIHDAGIFTDQCCEGIGYAMLGDLFPSSESFPEQDIVRQANSVCAPPSWAVNIKVGIIRCIPVGDEEPMTCAQWDAAALQNIYDAESLIDASCCFRNYVTTVNPHLTGMSVVIDRQVQGNPLGGCIERSLSLAVQIPNCECG